MVKPKLPTQIGQWLKRWLGARPKLSVLIVASAVSVFLYLVGAVLNHGFHYYYLIWNLFLAWLPLGLIYLLVKVLKRRAWSSWSALALTFLWVIFLPNSFYMVSDFVHLYDNASANVMYNVAMIASFAFSGLAIGLASLSQVHEQLVRRGHEVSLAWVIVGIILLISSYAVYLGRIIRLNSWDFFTDIGAVLYSVSDQTIHPSGWPEIIGVTLSFFLFLLSAYLVLRQLKPRLV